jgi:polar amino acid transport system substrate-binding protein
MQVLSSHRLARAVAVLASMAVIVGGCGSDDGSSEATSTPAAGGAKNAAAAAQVPAEIKRKGTLRVAADATYPPNESIAADGKTVVGMDADLAKALAAALGLKAQVVNATFDSIIPGLASGKYDLGMSSFTDTKEREQTVDFVTYFTAGTSFYVKKDGPDVGGLADLCGQKVAVEKGTTQAADVAAQGKKCMAAGKPAVKLSVFPDQNGANLAINSGRADIGMADSPVAAYQVQRSNGQFRLVGKPYGTAPYGIAIPKDNGMAKPVLAALEALMADGRYAAILKKWGVQQGAISSPKINGAIS